MHLNKKHFLFHFMRQTRWFTSLVLLIPIYMFAKKSCMLYNEKMKNYKIVNIVMNINGKKKVMVAKRNYESRSYITFPSHQGCKSYSCVPK